MSPVCVRLSGSVAALARPKSVTQTVPRVSRSRLEGLMSRCSTPRRGAQGTAPAPPTPPPAQPRQQAVLPQLLRQPAVGGRRRRGGGRGGHRAELLEHHQGGEQLADV